MLGSVPRRIIKGDDHEVEDLGRIVPSELVGSTSNDPGTEWVDGLVDQLMDEHKRRHPYEPGWRWMWTTSTDLNRKEPTRMVACRTCGFEEPYDPGKHSDVEDVD